MLYPIAEGQFETPEPVIDQSINVLVFQEPESHANYSIVINRDHMIASEDINEYCARQIEMMQRQFIEFKLDSELKTGTVSQYPAAYFSTQHKLNDALVYQKQTALLLDEKSGKTIIFTMTSSTPFNEAQIAHNNQIVKNFGESLAKKDPA